MDDTIKTKEVVNLLSNLLNDCHKKRNSMRKELEHEEKTTNHENKVLLLQGGISGLTFCIEVIDKEILDFSRKMKNAKN